MRLKPRVALYRIADPDRGLTQTLGLLNLWLGVIPDGVEVLLNKDFFGEQMSVDEAVKLMQIAQ